MNYQKVLGLGLALLLTLSACTGVPEVQVYETTVGAETTEQAPEPTSLPVSPMGKTVVADGQLESLYPSLKLGFEGGVSGQVLEVHVTAGDIVKAGDVLAVLDDTDLQRAVEDAQLTLDRAVLDRDQALVQWERDVAEAEASLIATRRTLTTTQLQSSSTAFEETRTALERARQAEHDAKKTYDTPVFGEWTPPEQREREYEAWQNAIRERELAELRMNDAVDTQRANWVDLDSREADVLQAERKLAALQDGIAPSHARAIEDAERELAKAQEKLDYVALKSPWDAIVLAVDIAPNGSVGAGGPVVTLLNITDGLRFVTQNLSEQHVASLRSGQSASVTLRTFPEDALDGTVEAVIPKTEVQQANDARFAVRVQLAPTDLNLLPGLTGRVEIFTEVNP